MPLIDNKSGEILENPWTIVEDDAELPEDGGIIVSVERWTRDKDTLSKTNRPLGVVLRSHEMPESIETDLDSFDLIAIDFPRFADGRGYSSARILREQMGFDGEIRAIGDVLVDQFLFMQRCGISTLEVAEDRLAHEWQKAVHAFSDFYQPTGDGRETIIQKRHRRPAAD